MLRPELSAAKERRPRSRVGQCRHVALVGAEFMNRKSASWYLHVLTLSATSRRSRSAAPWRLNGIDTHYRAAGSKAFSTLARTARALMPIAAGSCARLTSPHSRGRAAIYSVGHAPGKRVSPPGSERACLPRAPAATAPSRSSGCAAARVRRRRSTGSCQARPRGRTRARGCGSH